MHSRLQWLPVLVFCCAISTPAWTQTPPSPPFTYCPPVGANSSCRILIYIDASGSLRVLTDPNAALTYDQIEDTLVGVLNQSSNKIASIPLHGAGPIFGFDGDGICGTRPNPSDGIDTGQPFNPRPVGCPFGPTGYEGPGVNFSNISSDKTSGTVNFNPPIPPGEFRYFGLELAIQTLCPPINAPPGLRQDNPSWAGQPLGKSKQTIGSWGCYITSAAMMINYHAIKQGKTFLTDPLQLAQYLAAHSVIDPVTGYVIDIFDPTTGVVIGGGATLIAQYARDNGVQLYWAGLVNQRNDFTLDQYLCNGQPPLMYVGIKDHPHWVFPTGQATVNGVNTYSILDPISPNSTLQQGYSNQYSTLRLYTDDVDGHIAGLYITAHSPVELVLTDPNGAQTGFDPLTNAQLNSIPASGYLAESLADDSNLALPPTPPLKILEVVDPASGKYMLHVVGTGNGPYTLDILASDVNGALKARQFTGNIVTGQTIEYDITYSSAAGAQLVVTAQALQIVRAETFREGVLVFFRLFFTDPSNIAVGFGFKGAKGSGWAEENHPFSSPSYGRVFPGRVEYPFNHLCGQPGTYESDVEAWIYDTAGQRTPSVTIHLACSAPSQ